MHASCSRTLLPPLSFHEVAKEDEANYVTFKVQCCTSCVTNKFKVGNIFERGFSRSKEGLDHTTKLFTRWQKGAINNASREVCL